MRSLFYIAFVFILFSCAGNGDKLQISSESFPPEDIAVGDWSALRTHADDEKSGAEFIFPSGLLARLDSTSMADTVRTFSGLNKTYNVWAEICGFNHKNGNANFYSEDSALIVKWFQLNLNLLKITGEPKFADKIEQLVSVSNSEKIIGTNLIKQAVFTRNYDQLYVNLPIESSVQYRHTTGGIVRISQETMYSKAGLVSSIRVETSDKRFMELFIRIPVWAEYASVNVGGVKYKAVPGEYCRVGKTWKHGNVAVVSVFNIELS